MLTGVKESVATETSVERQARLQRKLDIAEKGHTPSQNSHDILLVVYVQATIASCELRLAPHQALHVTSYTGAYSETRHLEDGTRVIVGRGPTSHVFRAKSGHAQLPVLLRNGTNIDGLHGRAPHEHRKTDRLQTSRYVSVTVSVTTHPFISRFLSQVHGLVAANRSIPSSIYSCAQSIRACAVIALTVLRFQESIIIANTQTAK